MTDQNRKTLRSFYCRDYLWELFEVMTRDLGCSMDYLVNEAMRHYARSRNYSLAAPQSAPEDGPHRVPPPPPGAGAVPPPPLPSQNSCQQPGEQPPLHLVFNGQRSTISTEKFIIGRGSQMTDLTIRDGNISRKHCAVIYRGGSYFIKDLDSTNGIEFNGKRIEHKRIEEGDTFFLCDYEIRFTYR